MEKKARKGRGISGSVRAVRKVRAQREGGPISEQYEGEKWKNRRNDKRIFCGLVHQRRKE